MTATKRLLFASIGIIFHVALTFAQASDFEPTGNSRTLVAYFSATGNTRTVAQRIAELTGSDIYEIQPQRPYAENPYDDSQLIQNEAYNDLRPAVANLPSEETIARYDTIYVHTRRYRRYCSPVRSFFSISGVQFTLLGRMASWAS